LWADDCGRRRSDTLRVEEEVKGETEERKEGGG